MQTEKYGGNKGKKEKTTLKNVGNNHIFLKMCYNIQKELIQ